MATLERYTEIVQLRQRQVLTRWARGHIPFVSTSTTRLMDMFVFFLEEIGALKLLTTFPDARLRRTIGIYFFATTLLFKAILKANAYEALPSRLFSNTRLLRLLGFNLRQIEQGFSRKGDKRPFDVETLLDALRRLSTAQPHAWYVGEVLPFLTRALPWPPKFLLLDTIPILVDPEAKRAFPGAAWGHVRTTDGQEEYGFGYKLIVLGFPIGENRCGVLAVQVVGLNVADIEAGRELMAAVVAAHPNLLRGLPLVMDRAFLDAAWMATLKQEHGIDSVIPLKANMDLLDFMRALVTHEERPAWERVPGKPRRRIGFVDDLVDWGGHAVPLVGCYIEDLPRKQGGEPRCWGVVTTRTSLTTARAIHDQYGERWTIEEGFCQLRKLEEFDQLTVAHLGVITAQLLCECLAHTLAMGFLEELGQDYEAIGARRLRYDLLAQPTIVVVEIGNAYALLTPEEFNAYLDENLQAMAARQRRERARDGPAPAQKLRR
jgi:Transposase DDE domain